MAGENLRKTTTFRQKKGSSFIKVIDVFWAAEEGFSKIMILTRTKNLMLRPLCCRNTLPT